MGRLLYEGANEMLATTAETSETGPGLAHEPRQIADALHTIGVEDIEFEPLRIDIESRPANFTKGDAI